MKKRMIPGILLIFLVLCLALGAYLAAIYSSLEIKKAESKDRAVVQNIEADLIQFDDAIIFEQEFSKCGHTIIAPFAEREKLIGRSLDDLKKEYKEENGFNISYQENTLTIKQKVDDWCLVDKEKCRLKEYKGRIAVYQGPNSEEDILIRVTEIEFASLPDQVSAAIRNGEYEFENMERLNDALENLDEYL